MLVILICCKFKQERKRPVYPQPDPVDIVHYPEEDPVVEIGEAVGVEQQNVQGQYGQNVLRGGSFEPVNNDQNVEEN